MIRRTRGMIGRGMIRSAGQIAMSVLATLIATALYAGFFDRDTARGPAVHPTVTSGGKFDARVGGGELPPLPGSTRPVLSVVNWAITPPHPDGPIADIGWTALDGDGWASPAAGSAPAALPPSKPPRHAARRMVVANTPATSQTASLSQPDPGPGPGAPVVAAHGTVWTMAGATAQKLVSLGDSALALGGSAIGHLLP